MMNSLCLLEETRLLHTEWSLALSFSQRYSLILLSIDPFLLPYVTIRVSLVAQMVKNMPAMQKPWVGSSLGQEDPLKKEMAAHSSILACRIPWTEDLAGYSPWSRKELGKTEWRSACTHTRKRTHTHIHATIQIVVAYINMLMLIVYKIQCNIQCIVRL